MDGICARSSQNSIGQARVVSNERTMKQWIIYVTNISINLRL